MAITATCIYLEIVHPAAGAFYTQFRSEPIPSTGAGDFIAVAANPVALNNRVATHALAAIATHVPRKGALLFICHGTDKGLELAIGPDPDHPVFLQADTIRVLRANVEGQMSDAEAARHLLLANARGGDPTGGRRLNELKAAMARVHALQLTRVDLRACNTGKNPDTLERLQWFFNADVCCAPDSFDAFGPLPAPTITRDPGRWRDFLRQHREHSVYDDGTRRYALGYTLDGRTMLGAMATSPDAFGFWLARHLPPRPSTGGAANHYHALTRNMQSKLIFAGEQEFRDRLVSVTTGKGSTTVKVSRDALDPHNLP